MKKKPLSRRKVRFIPGPPGPVGMMGESGPPGRLEGATIGGLLVLSLVFGFLGGMLSTVVFFL